MASATSGVSVVTSGTGRNKRKDYYKTEVTTLGDGSLKRETFRTDPQGNNAVKVQELQVNSAGKVTKNTISSNAREAEKRALNDPNSQLRSSIKQQVDDAGKEVRKNEADAAAGRVTDAGKKNQEILGGGSGNKANKEEETGDNSQPAAQTEPPAPDKTRNDFPKNLIYPSDIGQSKQDIIKFNMVKYEPKKFSGVGFAARRSVSSENIIGSVILPVPGGITDTNAVSWGSDNLDPLQVALAQAALGFTSGGVEGATAAAESIGAGVAAGREDIKTAIAAAFAGQAAGVRSLITRTTGAIINPNMELLFQAPTLRPFNFTFKLSPRNKPEAEEVIRIIRFFKQGMSPITTPSNLFLKSPHTFKIQYKLRNDKEHPYIGKIKECALTGFTVDYTPDGNYATFEDGVMTSYQISMTFQELEPVFNSDYTELDNNEDTEIGY